MKQHKNRQARSCRRGHALRGPNAMETTGGCWVCRTAKVRFNFTLDLDEVADRLYSELVANKAKESVYVTA